MKDSKFQSEYTNSVNNISLPENYKAKILSALVEKDKELSGEASKTYTEVYTFPEPDKIDVSVDTTEISFNTTENNPRKKIRKFVPALACAAAALVIVTTAVAFFSRKPELPIKTNFDFSVSSATNLANISGAKVLFRDSNGELVKNENGETLTAYTDENGNIKITLPEGENYTAEITANGYISLQTPLKNEHIYISPVMNEDTYRAVLTWEEDSDLDAILTITKGDKFEQLFYFRSDIENEDGEVIAALDTDSQEPSAPETITFNTTDNSVFRFSVASYSALKNSDNLDLSSSGAQVVLYKGDRIVDTYKVPHDVSGNAWCIFEVHNDKLYVHNEIYTVDSILEVK